MLIQLKAHHNSARCDRHHARGDLQPVSQKTDQQRQNNDFYWGTAI